MFLPTDLLLTGSRGLMAMAFFGLLVALPFSAGAQEPTMENYNVIVLNDFSTTSEVEGRTLIAHDLTSTAASNFAIHLAPVATTDRSLVVGHNIVNGGPLSLQRGSLYIGGTTNGRPINHNGGGSTITQSLDVPGLQTRYHDAADYYSGLASNSTASLPTNQPAAVTFNAVANDDGVAIFTVSGSAVFNSQLVQQIQLNLGTGVTDVVINVSGTDINWNTGSNMVGNFQTDYWQGHVLWNFYEATTINFTHQFSGAILAPYASITTNQNIDGAVVAYNLTTSSEVHLPASQGPAYSGVPVETVPEPGSVALFGLGAAVVLGSLRRRARG